MPFDLDKLLDDGNFSFGPESGFFYTFHNSRKELLQLQTNGLEVDSFFVTGNVVRSQVKELHFDGTYFWTLENLVGGQGVSVREWRLSPVPSIGFSGTPSEFRWINEINLINTPVVKFVSNAFCVEHYHITFAANANQGASSIQVSDASRIDVGDILNLGPSLASGFIDHEESFVVAGKSGNTISVGKIGGLTSGYLASDSIDFTKSIFVFNDHGLTGTADNQGLMVRISWPDLNIIDTDSGAHYNGVTAAAFEAGIVSFVRANQIMRISVDIPGLVILDSQEANLKQSDRFTDLTVFDLIDDVPNNNQYLKLQQKITDESIGITTDFSPEFNFQAHTVLSVVNSVTMEFSRRIIGNLQSGDTISILGRVLDQYGLAALGQTVQFSAAVNSELSPGGGTIGTFNPVSSVTNVSGEVTTIYTPSSFSSDTYIDITATVNPPLDRVVEQVTGVILQAASFNSNPLGLNPSPSRPIEQRADLSVSPKPIEQKDPPRTAKLGAIELSKPIEQVGIIQFLGSPSGADIIEQKGIPESEAEPIEQVQKSTSVGLVQQFVTTSTFSPLEQKDVLTNDIEIEQFDFITNIFPVCGSTKVPVNTSILWQIREFANPYDADSIIFTVQGIEVQDTAEFSVTGIVGGLSLFYNPPEDFPFDTEVTVTLTITDTSIPPITFTTVCSWRTVPDTKPPIITNLLPACDFINVDVAEPISFDVVDAGLGVDPSSITLAIEGITVCSGITLTTTAIPGSGTGFHVVYEHPDRLFRYGTNVSVAIEASDVAEPPNSTFFVCTFSTEDSSAPEFFNINPEPCEVFVDNTTGLVFEVYGLEAGVDIATLEVRVGNITRRVIVRPKLLRRE